VGNARRREEEGKGNSLGAACINKIGKYINEGPAIELNGAGTFVESKRLLGKKGGNSYGTGGGGDVQGKGRRII